MKRFLTKLSVFTAVAIGFYVVALVGLSIPFSRYLDNYSRIIKEHSGSTIFGSSRTSVGIDPQELNGPGNPWLPFYNFSGTAYHTPYGPAYYSFIQRKNRFNSYRPDRIFLLSADPWSVGCEEGSDRESCFSENTTFTRRLRTVHGKVNPGYLFRFTDRPLLTLLQALLFHNIGWIKEDGKFEYPISLQDCLKRHKKRYAEAIKMHQEFVYTKKGKISTLRMLYLDRTITWLMQYGKVVLVRMPVTDGMLALENVLDRDFSLRMTTLARSHQCIFLDYSDKNEGLVFVDDNHLYNTSARSFSKQLGMDLAKAFSR